ncbi:MAG: anaerobic ribonucleoside-triphosphate reductase activating protein [Alphaproteobacteria bacterium]|jgi:pyruvate formate lyase activating enzyme|nr:anaerobic ribonucleoside-triphosphate reductase activating protein [Alphaproteobacteria bacterium]
MIQKSKVILSGFEPFTTIDYPGKISCVVFLQGCNLDCAYCSNPETNLIVSKDDYVEQFKKNWDSVLSKINDRKNFLDAVVFSGGEALVQVDELLTAIDEVKDINPDFKIGLHTNGVLPENLKKIIDKVDWVGLDIKTSEKKYHELSCNKKSNHFNDIRSSLEVLIQANKKFEVRTTCYPKYVNKYDVLEIANMCNDMGVSHYALQKYITVSDSDMEPTDREINSFFIDDDFLDKLKEFNFELILRK